MGKIILEFDSVEESQDARVALDAMKWKMSMWDLDQYLRGIVKHGEGSHSSEQIEFADKLRKEIRDIINDYGLNLND
jgi:hypothetical protein